MSKTLSKKLQRKELEAEAKRQRALVKDVLYTWLLKNTKSVEEAKVMCKAAVLIMQECFSNKVDAARIVEQNRLSRLTFKELGISDNVKNKEEKKAMKEFEPLFNLFADERVATTESLLLGMANAIESFQKKEMSGRKLDTLTTDFL